MRLYIYNREEIQEDKTQKFLTTMLTSINVNTIHKLTKGKKIERLIFQSIVEHKILTWGGSQHFEMLTNTLPSR